MHCPVWFVLSSVPTLVAIANSLPMLDLSCLSFYVSCTSQVDEDKLLTLISQKV